MSTMNQKKFPFKDVCRGCRCVFLKDIPRKKTLGQVRQYMYRRTHKVLNDSI